MTTPVSDDGASEAEGWDRGLERLHEHDLDAMTADNVAKISALLQVGWPENAVTLNLNPAANSLYDCEIPDTAANQNMIVDRQLRVLGGTALMGRDTVTDSDGAVRTIHTYIGMRGQKEEFYLEIHEICRTDAATGDQTRTVGMRARRFVPEEKPPEVPQELAARLQRQPRLRWLGRLSSTYKDR